MRHLWWLLVPVCVGLAAPAQARPRDEALAMLDKLIAIYKNEE